LRLLTNLETAERKLLQIVLIGQPELRTMLAQPGLEQLAQRVIARYHLGPLTAPETRHYVEHRLAVAGLNRPLPFDAAALAAIHQHSAGVPRRINLLADRALLGAYAQQRPGVDRGMVQHAAQEVFDPAPVGAGWGRWLSGPGRSWAAAVFALLLLGGGLAWLGRPAAPVDEAPAVALASPGVGEAAALAASGVDDASRASPVAAVPAPAADGLPELLSAAHRDEALAWRELALRWNVSIGDGDPCSVAAQAQLACFKSSTGGLAQLRQLQRPALLVLRQGTQPRVHAVLVALDARQATLQVGARSFQVPLAALAGVWRGEFATFWRTPPGWRPGLDAAGRVWLQAQLAQAMPEAAASPPRSQADQVAAFQLLQGLPVDGQAGPLTLMQLNRSTGVEEPRLLQPPER
ncbi:MAG: peptidoglycan-binding protein, partial [Rubrivivax sp.]|nr:peptidoglycan-binding protein [Rubrivivax sp.]